MRILIFAAIHKRPEITELFLMGIKRLQIYSGHQVELFCVCSEQSDIDLLTSKGIEFCVYENKPLGNKMDFGFKEALKKDFDYMLRMGSDDLLDHEIFNHYNQLMNKGTPFFGIKTIGVVDFKTLDSIIYKYNHNRPDRPLGGGQMISRALCMEFKDRPLFNKKPINRGLDAASELELSKFSKPVIVTTKEPSLIDFKTEFNIWSFNFVSKRLPKVDFDKLTHFLSKEEYRYLTTKRTEFRVVAVIPVKGRLPLLRHTIERLIQKNGVYKVICVGDSTEDEVVCKVSGAEFVRHDNKPLGKKWNAGFMKAKEYGPDACLFVGSSDWISDNWIEVCEPFLGQYDMIGKPDFNLLDYGKKLRLCHWAGYTDSRRKDEPIGIGRLISKRILDKLDWQPMDSKLDSSLDYSMWQKVLKAGGKVKLLVTDKIQSLSLSTDQWENKHNFNSHWLNHKGVESEKITDHETFLKAFPEAYEL